MARKKVTQPPVSAPVPAPAPVQAAVPGPAAPAKPQKPKAAPSATRSSRAAAPAPAASAKLALDTPASRGLGSTVESLKQRFSARKIPLEGDFADLIDVADCGRKAVGLAPGQPGGPGYGLDLMQDGRLGVKAGNGVNTANGVTVNLGQGLGFDGANRVVALAGNGVVVSDLGIAAKAGLGIDVTSQGIAAKAGMGVTVGASGIAVKVGQGLKVDTTSGVSANVASGLMVDQNNAVAVKVGIGLNVDGTGLFAKAGSGINVSSSGGIAVKTGYGLTLDLNNAVVAKAGLGMGVSPSRGIEPALGNGLQFKYTSSSEAVIEAKLGSGLTFSANAIVPKLGNGLVIDQDLGIAVTPAVMIPKGVIVMFSGTKAPDGWAFCDGANGTPDLRGRFILGSENSSEIGGKSSQPAQGEVGSKQYKQQSFASSVPLDIHIGETVLTHAQMPMHYHYDGQRRLSSGTNAGAMSENGWIVYNRSALVSPAPAIQATEYALTRTSESGGYEGHSHTAMVWGNSSSHSHTVNLVPAYYILAYIIKL